MANFSCRFLALCMAAWLVAASAWAVSVTFINPGKHDELFWQTSSSAMQAAALQLGFKLEVSYAERSPLRALEIARLLAARPAAQQPDVVIFSNDQGTGPELLQIFANTRTHCFMAYSTLYTADERKRGGEPRGKYPNWLGSLVPDAEVAGYLVAKQLLAQGRRAGLQGGDGRLQVIALAGDRSTPSSIRRNRGLQRAVADSSDAVLRQMVYANWQLAKATEQSSWLYERYPEARLIWSGSDIMAFGAMQSWQARGGVVGKTAVFSAFNTSPEAMQAIGDGRLSALAGGHFMAGAWSLVLIYDYLHGRDFAGEGLEMEAPMFGLITPELARQYQRRFGTQNFGSIDFRRYSRWHHPALLHYPFTLQSWLK